MRVSTGDGFTVFTRMLAWANSFAADFINGTVLYVDGGITANFGYVKGENVV